MASGFSPALLCMPGPSAGSDVERGNQISRSREGCGHRVFKPSIIEETPPPLGSGGAGGSCLPLTL